MPSKHAKIWVALKTHLEAYSKKPSYIAYPSESFNPPNDAITPYWIVDDLRFDPLRIYYGSDCGNWLTGSLFVNCMIPLSWTSVQTAEYAGAVADYFKQDTEMAYDDMSVRVSNSPLVSSGYRDGDRWRVPVTIRWEGFG